MSKRVRHIHAKSNEYIKVHRKHEDSGNGAIAVLIIIGGILFFVFWKQIVIFLAFVAIIGLIGWLLCCFHSEIFSGIVGFFKLIYKFATWLFKNIAKLFKKNPSAANNTIPKQTGTQFDCFADTNYGKIIQKH